MLKTNWHTHTARCGHAVGTDEEYVQAAIRGGVKTLGFSEHAAYMEPNRRERMDIGLVPDYMESIRNLRDKYKGQIDIHLGMEVEYYEDQWDILSVYRKQMEYVILGQHNLAFDTESTYYLNTPGELARYVDLLEKACEHSLCDYIAHPDVCMWAYPAVDGTVRQIAARIADISVKYNMPLELNCGSGVKRGKKKYNDGERYAYPVRVFFEEFAKKGCPVIIGLDIHDPKLFETDLYIERAMSVCEGLDINWLRDFDLVAAAAERKRSFY